MSAISNTSTKTSKVRAKLHKEFADKFEAQSIQIAKLIEEKKAQENQAQAFQQKLTEMTAMLKTLYAQSPPRPPTAPDESSQNSGEPTTDNTPQNQPSEPKQTTENQPKDTLMQLLSNSYKEDKSDHSLLPKLNPDYNLDEDFHDDDQDYLNFKDQQDQKEAEARKRGEKYIREEWYGSQPAEIPLPESYEEFDPLNKEKTQQKKRLVITDSDDIDPNDLEQYFESNRSGREKKRQNAPGSINSGKDE